MEEAKAILAELPIFQMMPSALRETVSQAFVLESHPFGSEIVSEGAEADAYFVLRSGTARVVKTAASGEEIALGRLRPGDGFGEAGLLGRNTRTATVRASSEVSVLRLGREAFESLLLRHREVRTYFELRVRQQALANFLRVYSPFAALPGEALHLLLSGLEPESVEVGALVVREGEPADALFLVEEGRLRAYREPEGARRYLGYLRKGDFFGEKALFRNEKRAASVEAVTQCRLLRLSRATFERLVAEYPEFRARIEERIAQLDYPELARVPLDFAEELLPADARRPGPEAAPLEAGPAERPDRRRIRRMPFVAQIDETDCGAACLAMVCRHFGRAVSLVRIRQLAAAAYDGTSLRDLCRAAEELGLAARAVKASAEDLAELPLPAILHWDTNHWVVLWDRGERHARVGDPAAGLLRIELAELAARWSGYAALFDYTEAFDSAPEDRPRLGWLAPLARPYVPWLLRALGLALVVSALQMAFPVATQIVVDRVLVEQDAGLLRMLILAMGVVLVFMFTALAAQRYLLSYAAVRIDAAALDFLTRRLLSLPMSYFTSRRTADVQRRLEGVREVRELLVEGGVIALSSATQLAAALVLMAIYSPVLTLAFLAMAPFYGLLMFFARRRMGPLYAGLEESFARYQSHQFDAIKGIATLKALSAEGGFREQMLERFHRIGRRIFQTDLTVMGYEASVDSLVVVSTLLFLWVGAHQVMAGELTIGAFVAFNALVGLANVPIAALLRLWDDLQHRSVLANRLADVLEQTPEQGPDRSALRPVRSLEGRLTLNGLSFRYGGPESPPILRELHLDIPPGIKLAIVGRSGSGKTTLLRCLAGLLEPSEGSILYDGIDMRTLNYRDLRRQIGCVLQESYLFDDTIARNIALGEAEPDLERVIWSARLAHADAFVERLPLGYDTGVGESGIALSGGQRQRIAIARALYPRPAILVLDEATSSLDVESERVVQENLAGWLVGHTCVVVAHRLSTVRDADLIVVLDQGRIVEQGGHSELLARRGLYYYLTSQQLEL